MTDLSKKYRMQQMHCDTRMGLVIRLYDAAIAKIDAAVECYEIAPNSADFPRLCLKATELVHAIQVGLDLSQGEVPNNIHRLCEFAMHEVLSREKPRLLAAKRVLSTLASGYLAVRDEADAFERDHLPPLSDSVALVDATC